MNELTLLIQTLKEYAKTPLATDYLPEGECYDVADASGHNFDDAYDIGFEHGTTTLAREILDQLNIEYKD